MQSPLQAQPTLCQLWYRRPVGRMALLFPNAMLRNNGRSAVSNSITHRTGAGCSITALSWSGDCGSIIHDRRTYGRWTVWKQAGGLAGESLAADGGGAGSGRGVLRVMVLGVARVAWFLRGSRRCVALAMAGRCSVGAWICGSHALCLGLRMDRTRHTRSRDRKST